MKMSLSSFFDRMEAAYRVGDYDAVAKCYALPGAAYLNDDVVVFPNFTVLRGMLKDQCRLNYDLGVRYSRPRLVGQSVSRANNYSAWVYWKHFDAQGAVVNSYNARYICRDNSNGIPRIQLVEFLTLPACFAGGHKAWVPEPKRKRT